MTCPEVARLLGDAPRSVENSVHRFDQQGLVGLTEGERPGRPSRLDEKQVKEINRVLRAKPSDAGMRVNLSLSPSQPPRNPALRSPVTMGRVSEAAIFFGTVCEWFDIHKEQTGRMGHELTRNAKCCETQNSMEQG
jgi:transposase